MLGAIPRRALARLVLTAALLAAPGASSTLLAQSVTVDPALLQSVAPGANDFGPPEGSPPAMAVRRDGALTGYAFLTRDVVASAGYSGKPLNVLVAIDLSARITGAAIVEQHEPILVIGVSPADLDAFVARLAGLDLREPIRVTRPAAGGPGTIDAVSGATISSMLIGDVVLRAARAVATSRGLLGGAAGRLVLESDETATFADLVADGSLQSSRLQVDEVSARLDAVDARLYPPGAGPAPDATFIEIFLGLATPARIGRNLLGDRTFGRILGEIGAGDHLVFVGGAGTYSFKGTRYVREGTFDRIRIVQGERSIELHADDHVRIESLEPGDAPELRELAVFIVRGDTGFVPDEPWQLDLLVTGRRPDGSTAEVSIPFGYELPKRYLREPAPDVAEPDAPLWVGVWNDRIVDAVCLALILAVLSAILVFQDAIARRPKAFRYLRLGFLVVTLLWIGWYAGAQLSVLNVLTFAEALRTEFRWDFFLIEPLIFILWSYVAVALIFWGRGVFCGWLCPFGALQELTNKIARWARVPQVRIPFPLHERLWPVKFIVFLGLFALSLGPMEQALRLAEVEPFKTAIVLRFDRALPFVGYAVAILLVGLFVERAFCRYLCPLGAAFAMPARLRQFEWLKRRHQCGQQCHICAVDCPVQAIHPDGEINTGECIYCLACQINYFDDHTCTPLIERRKRREKREAMAAAGASARRAPPAEQD